MTWLCSPDCYGQAIELVCCFTTVIAAIASRPTEALSLMMLEDDRAVRLIEEYEGCLSEEMQWMAHISDPVWEILALVACIEGSTGRAIRSACLDCAHTSCSYSHRNFLSHVRSLPWSLERETNRNFSFVEKQHGANGSSRIE